MPSSFITANKRPLAAHWNACKPFFLLSGWAAIAAYTLMLLCLYPYPITVAELVTVFLKLFLLSNFTVLDVYVLFIITKVVGRKVIVQLPVRAMAKARRRKVLMHDAFPALSADSCSVLVEPALCYQENILLPSLC